MPSKKPTKTTQNKPSAPLAQIGTLISRLREKEGMTQADLAKAIGTAQSAIARIEKGEQNLSIEMLAKISAALNRDIVTVNPGTLNFHIEGGRTLSGEITTKTSKNAAMGLLSAVLLNKGKTTLMNMPRIEEVNRMVEVLTSIGVKATWTGNNLEIIPPAKINIANINATAAEKTRSVIMLAGSLVHHLTSFALPQAGGCKLGSRTVKPHFLALEKFGIKIKTTETAYEVSHKSLKPATVILYESGDTTTENALLAAALVPGKSVIKYASANYQVQDVCLFLQALGVKIEGIGTSVLTVHGVKEINTDISYSPSEDPIESMFFIAAAIMTNSSIIIRRCPLDFLELELLKLEHMGFKYKILSEYKAANGYTRLGDIQTFPSKLTALEEKIHANVYPGLNMDNLPFFALIATQAKGETLIHDWSYEKRAIYYKELDKLGADTALSDPHRFYVHGPTPFKAADIVSPPALRPAAILMLGMLGAKGTSTLRNIYSISRGYENIAERLNALGANISIFRE